MMGGGSGAGEPRQAEDEVNHSAHYFFS